MESASARRLERDRDRDCRRERRREAERAVRVVVRRRARRRSRLRGRLRRRARRRADDGVAVHLAVDPVLSEDGVEDAADPPAWKSNIGRHAIDAENFHTATHSLYSASHWPSVQEPHCSANFGSCWNSLTKAADRTDGEVRSAVIESTPSTNAAAATPPTRSEVLVLGLLFSRVASDSRSVAGTVAYEAMIYAVCLRERNQWALARRRVGVGVIYVYTRAQSVRANSELRAMLGYVCLARRET